MKRVVTFVDADNSRVDVTIETERGYLSICADMGSSGGQCQDSINPANEGQEQLIELWNEYHLKNLNDISIPIEDTLEDCCTLIEEYETERKGDTLISELDEEEALAIIRDVSNDDEDEIYVICQMFDLTANEIDDIAIEGNNRICVQGTDYLFGTDSDMDDEWDASLDSYLEECVYPELSGNLAQYFDDEAWKSDARMDGRGHSLNSYDGGEIEYEHNGTYYYAYRQ